jgi:uncharacterized protein (TIGR02271 family)
MPHLNDIQAWKGRTLVDRDGDKVGTIGDVYLDQETGQPEWIAVTTGLFGSNVSFVPIAEAQPDGDVVRVRYEKSHIKDSPNVDADGELSEQEEARLYAHYGRDYADSGRGPVGEDVSGPETDDAMTRSEEELAVGTRRHEAGRVRLRKHIVTEPVQRTVQVQREEVRLEREPITEANRDDALSGGDLTEEEHEVTLHAEEPVVDKRVVPKERVRLDTDTVTEDAQVNDELRKERIETEGDLSARRKR